MATKADTCRKFVVPNHKLQAKPAGWDSDPHSIVEQQTRQQIDAKLGALGWMVQDTPTMTLTALWCRGSYSQGDWMPLTERRRNVRPNGDFAGEDA